MNEEEAQTSGAGGGEGEGEGILRRPSFYCNCCLPTCWIGCGVYFFLTAYESGWTTATFTDFIMSLYILASIVGGGLVGFISFLLYIGDCRKARRGLELGVSMALGGFGCFAIFFNGNPSPSFRESLLYTWLLACFAFNLFFILYSLIALILSCRCARNQMSAKEKGELITSIEEIDMELGGGRGAGMSFPLAPITAAPTPRPTLWQRLMAKPEWQIPRPPPPPPPPPPPLQISTPPDIADFSSLNASDEDMEPPDPAAKEVAAEKEGLDPLSFFWSFFSPQAPAPSSSTAGAGAGAAPAPAPTAGAGGGASAPAVVNVNVVSDEAKAKKKKIKKKAENVTSPSGAGPALSTTKEKKKKKKKKTSGNELAVSLEVVRPSGNYVCS